MSKIQFDVNISNGVDINFANNLLPVSWMEVYPKCFIQLKLLLHATSKCLENNCFTTIQQRRAVGTLFLHLYSFIFLY